MLTVLFYLSIALASRKDSRGNRNQNNNLTVRNTKKVCYGVYDDRLTQCSIPCRVLDLVDSNPFEWVNCLSTPKQVGLTENNGGRKQINFPVPILTSKVPLPKKSIKSKKDSDKFLVVDSVPATSELASGSYLSVGQYNITYHGVVVRNECYLDTSTDIINKMAKFNLTESSIFSECTIQVNVHNNKPPKFTFCPGSREYQLIRGQNHIKFEYDKPIAEDNSGATVNIKQIKGVRSGEKLDNGKHTYLFVAEDNDGNKSYCEFTVRVHRYVDQQYLQSPQRQHLQSLFADSKPKSIKKG